MFEDLLRSWDGEEVCLRYDEPTGAWMFVCVHSTVLGPGMGGTRMKAYPSPGDALADGLRLSEAMTFKHAMARLPYGGAKAVVAVPDVPEHGSPERRAVLERYADLVASLGGTYVTAADMNTGPADMEVIAERCPFVLGRSPAMGGSGDPGEATATGVFHGVRASLRHAVGSDELTGRVVLIQGVGSVGRRLAARLADAGASLLVADVDGARAKDVAAGLGATAIPEEAAIGTPCDVFAPCAVGAVLAEDSIPRLDCRVVAGAANNQLAAPSDAERLRDAGILYAPDFVINAGGVIHLAGRETLGWDGAEVAARLAGIEQTLADVFEASDRDGITTAESANRIARERLEIGRQARA